MNEIAINLLKEKFKKYEGDIIVYNKRNDIKKLEIDENNKKIQEILNHIQKLQISIKILENEKILNYIMGDNK